MKRSFGFLIVLFASLQCLAGAEGKGGGDTVTCGTDKAVAAEVYDAVIKLGRKKAIPLMNQLEFDSAPQLNPYYLNEDEILSLLIESVEQQKRDSSEAKEELTGFSEIRAQLHFELVDQFSGEIPKTGHRVNFLGWLYGDCHTFFTARQYFKTNKVELLEGYSTESHFQGVPSVNVKHNWGYDYTSDFSRPTLKFHEIVLHAMWEKHPDYSITDLETLTRNYVVSAFVSPGFLQALVDKFNFLVIKKYEATNPAPLVCPGENEEGQLKCTLGKWAGVSYYFPESFPVGLVWAGGHGKNSPTSHPVRQDLDNLVKEITVNIDNPDLMADLKKNIGPDTWVIYDLLFHKYWLP